MPTRLNSPQKLFIPFASSSSTLFTGPLTVTDGFIKYSIINFGFEHVAIFVTYFMIFLWFDILAYPNRREDWTAKREKGILKIKHLNLSIYMDEGTFPSDLKDGYFLFG